MLGDSEIRLSFSGPSLLTIPLMICVIIFSFWVYRQTVPPVHRPIRLLLAFLRAFVFVLLVCLLFGPVIHITVRENQRADVALLVDNTRSMRIVEEGESRGNRLLKLLSSPAMDNLKKQVSIHSFVFSDRLVRFENSAPDSLSFDGSATDMAKTIRTLYETGNESPFRSALIVSDGAHNLGEDPVRIGERSPFPLYTVTIGKTVTQPDVILTRLVSNDIAYVGDEVPVEVTLRGPDFAGEAVTVSVKQGDEILDRTQVTLPPDGLEISTRLRFIAHQPGMIGMNAEVSRLEGEMTFENNMQDFSTHVLKSKIGVLFLADRPGPDVSFLTRHLRSDENIEVTIRTRRKDGGFYEGAFPDRRKWETYDLLFLLDFPSSETPEAGWRPVGELLKSLKKPVFIVAGKNLQFSRFSPMEYLIPVTGSVSMSERLVLPQLTSEGETHTVLRVLESSDANKDAWHRLPPIFTSWRSVRTKPDARLGLHGVPEGRSNPNSVEFPLVVSRQLGEQKTLLLMGHGLYRWDLLMESIGGSNDILKGFLSRSVRWLTTREAEKRVRLSVQKRLFRAGEDIVFTVEVYDEMYRPFEQATVDMRVISRGDTSSLRLEDVGVGQYRNVYRLFDPGPVKVRVEASFQGIVVGEDEMDLLISASSREFFRTEADPRLMSNLARISGGTSGPADSLETVIQSMNLTEQQLVRTEEMHLAHGPVMLLILLLLLTLEWLIRRRRGMV